MRVAVLASGGVDSSVALRLLLESGHQVEAFYLKIWLEEELAFLGDCPWEDDLEAVRAVCDEHGVPLTTVPLQTRYRQTVVDFALDELRAGRTPSPDVFCNQWIKFGEFFDFIDSDFERVASGHYARIEEEKGLCALLRSPDAIKDQTYFLHRLSQDQLRRVLFPIGHLNKVEVRRLACDFALPNRDRPDSQGICFLGKIKYNEFVRFHLGERPGQIVEAETGRVLGEHQGYWFHTIGQRQGLGLSGGPWYVVGKGAAANRIVVSHRERFLEQSRNRFSVGGMHWIGPVPETEELQVKLRHGPHLEGCRLFRLDDERWRVEMDAADPGVAPGQFAVFYQGEVCLGGGMIECGEADPWN